MSKTSVFPMSYLSVVALIFVIGCNTTKPLEIASGIKPDRFQNIEADEESSLFALSKVVSDIGRNEPILAFPLETIVDSVYCNFRTRGDNAVVTYSGGNEYLGDWSNDIGEVFHETWTRLGYEVAGDPGDIFFKGETVGSAKYLVGGRLTKMSGNICHQHHWWDGRPLFEYGGEMSLTIEWSILNTLTKSVIHKESTTGTARLETPIRGGTSTLFDDAFADAADSFARSETVRKIATGQQTVSIATANESEGSVVISQGSSLPSIDIAALSNSVATIRVGGGHGSGFFVGRGGYLLTNQHVVGDAKQVAVVTKSGIEVEGTVVARSKARDVALVKTPIRTQRVLHLKRQLPSIADEVYAVGTPIKESLNTTVTRGIVSAIRKDVSSGLDFIQADAAISPGNSGGPLFDGSGNVVGISVAKYSIGIGEGLGLFIPIGSALDSVNVSMK